MTGVQTCALPIYLTCAWNAGSNSCEQISLFQYNTSNPSSCTLDSTGCVYDQSSGSCGSGESSFDVSYTTTAGNVSNCVIPSRTLLCPSQIALPFFSQSNFIISLISVMIIYGFLSFRKKEE